MPFQVSPGVNVSEIDLSASIPSVSTSTGAIAGPFRWGPVEKIMQVTSEGDLASKFGAPTPNSDIVSNTFFTSTSYLAYSNDLLVVRAAASNMNTAVANANLATTVTSTPIKNEDTYFTNFYNGGGAGLTNAAFAARFPGELGNSLAISVCPSNTAFANWAYKDQFTSGPSTSAFVRARSSANANDEMHIAVIDMDGLFSGVANTVIEKYSHISKASDAKNDDGSSNYYKEVLYRNSKYIYWVNHITNNDTAGTATNTSNWGVVSANATFGASQNNYTANLVSGVDGTTVTANISTAYNLYSSTETTEVSLLLGGDPDATLAGTLLNIAESRKDCVAFISPDFANCVSSTPATSIVNYRNTLSSSSYVIMDSGWKYMYDKYNDRYRWVPMNGDVAGLCSRTDNQRDPWFSPAGYQRGVLRNVVKLLFNPKQSERDTMYKSGVNPIVSFPGEGTVLFGDKTLLSRPSAFDRINVRRLFIVLEKAIARAAKNSLFEFNDEFTRAQFVSLVEPFLRTVQGRRGIYDFRVVCDESNNTADVIDRNEFVGDIYIKPARSVNYIQLNFVAVRTGVAFDEVVGKF